MLWKGMGIDSIMDITIQFKDVTEEFALKLAQAMAGKPKVPSINKDEAMTEDLSEAELKVLDILSDHINAGTLKTEPEPVSLTEVAREVLTRFVEAGITLLEAKGFTDEVRSEFESRGGEILAGRRLNDRCRDVAKRMGARSIQKGLWKLPKLDQLT